MTLRGRYFQIFVLNLSAPFTTQVFGAQLPHIDYLIGDEAESEVWASANGLPAVIKALAQQPESNPTRDCLPVVQPSLSVSAILITSGRTLSTLPGVKRPSIRTVPESVLWLSEGYLKKSSELVTP